jgi:5-methylthioribose kinase
MAKFGCQPHHDVDMLLKPDLDQNLLELLLQGAFIEKDEKVVSYSKAGEGNMNLVYRLETDRKSIVLKEALPYVAKYPSISAPIERINAEIAYYTEIFKNKTLASFSPKILGQMPESHLFVMEDLGSGKDFLDIYAHANILEYEHISMAMGYLSTLHSLKIESFIENTEMKALNHFHIFDFPFQADNGFDLDLIAEGLKDFAKSYKNDQVLKNIIYEMGENYLKKGRKLLHGDFYPGSILNIKGQIKVIDPEFCFLGDPEFDLGVFKAHLILAGHSAADNFLSYYSEAVNVDTINKYAGIEILRRILGVAQLPLSLNVFELCEQARNLIKGE